MAALLHGLSLASLHGLAGHELFWVLVALIVLGEIWPIVTPGGPATIAGVASVTFSFAALLFWGFPVAAAAARASRRWSSAGRAQGAVPQRVQRGPVHAEPARGRGWSLAVGRVHPAPLRPWVPTGAELGSVGLAALAYFVVNFLLVGVGRSRCTSARRCRVTLRQALPYQAFVNLVLLSAAPLVVGGDEPVLGAAGAAVRCSR